MTGILTAGKMKNKQAGYSYLMMLVVAASLGLAASALGAVLYERGLRIEKEKELLFRGMAYVRAIESFNLNSISGTKYPETLEQLVTDARISKVKHIRRLYEDPVTGGDWELILTPEGRICGVNSSSKRKPLKRGDFPEGFEDFEKAEHYSDWKFVCK